ncbi:MAG: aspartate 1-decarboxylase [Thaumarchaeota archaeon]|jgi:aspartate 1-decarboxylase|nr:aspartate 1-decarboxylase [Nitrososphaerota archaeon]
MRMMLKSKIHCARVTGLNIDYEGSITIGRNLMEEADILVYEQVEVLNLNNGARFTTYAISSKIESDQICLNGAAARLANKGDMIIILSYCQIEESEAVNFMPKLVYVDDKNNIVETKRAIEAMPF